MTISNAEVATLSKEHINICVGIRHRARTSEHFRRRLENSEHGAPTRPHVLHSGLYHLLETLQDLDKTLSRCLDFNDRAFYHVTDVRVSIMDHGVLERLQKILLEFEMW